MELLSTLFFFTTSNYYSCEQIRSQVASAIHNLGLPAFAKVDITSVSEITATECSMFSPIENSYKPLKKAAIDMKLRMEEEELRRGGYKCIRLILFFKRVNSILSSDCCYDD